MIFNVISLLLKIFEGHRLIQESKKKGVLLYLKVLQAVRTSIVGALIVFFALQIFIVAVVGIVLTVLYLVPLENETKAWILLGLCGTIVLFVALVLNHIFSEKTWFKYSGASQFIRK
ncbi:MAG: hypothetical protein B7Y39_00315 [Bdellovibrio sp. 28-41-41]|nr:MAG: hypothetical protein B7Y39_00315 [Bdellovibrio sp. 28-41-41]